MTTFSWFSLKWLKWPLFHVFLWFSPTRNNALAKGIWQFWHFWETVVSVVSIYSVKKDPVKTAHFGENPYLILIVLVKKSIFDVFDEKVINLDTFLTPKMVVGKTALSCLKSLSNPRGWCKSAKYHKIHENHRNDQFSSKCHRQIWHLQKWHFSSKSHKF